MVKQAGDPKKTRAGAPKKTRAGAPTTPRALDEQRLCPGDVVMLPDGGVAAVERIVGSDAYVVEWQKQWGRGPWIFPISELVLV